jgi:hypothetical protein
MFAPFCAIRTPRDSAEPDLGHVNGKLQKVLLSPLSSDGKVDSNGDPVCVRGGYGAAFNTREACLDGMKGLTFVYGGGHVVVTIKAPCKDMASVGLQSVFVHLEPSDGKAEHALGRGNTLKPSEGDRVSLWVKPLKDGRMHVMAKVGKNKTCPVTLSLGQVLRPKEANGRSPAKAMKVKVYLQNDSSKVKNFRLGVDPDCDQE